MNYHSAGMIAGLLSIAGIGCPAFATVYVSGQVIINKRNTPAPGVTLAVYEPSDAENPVGVCQTLRNGSFVLKVPKAGSYRLLAKGPVYTEAEQSLVVPAAGLNSQTIRVDHLPSIQFHLGNSNRKASINGTAEFWVSVVGDVALPNGMGGRGGRRRGRGGMTLSFTEPVDAEGVSEITLPEGMQAGGISAVLVRARCAGVGCAEVQLDHWPDSPVAIHLEPGSTLEGRVLDEVGKPMANAPITVAPVMSLGRGRLRQADAGVTSNQDGSFRMTELLPGGYYVGAQTPDGNFYFQTVQIDGPTATITLTPGGSSSRRQFRRRAQ